GIKRVMVTGASGKLGCPLCEALLEEDYEVVGVDYRLPTGIDGVEEVKADVGDREAIEELVSRSDAVIHLASCKEDRDAFIDVSARGTFNILDAAMRTKKPKRVILASGDCVNGIYFYDNPLPINEQMPMRAYPGYYALSKVVEETMFTQQYIQAGVPTIVNRMSWIQSEDDILSHLTVAGEDFGVPVWPELMDDAQRAEYADGNDAAVALGHPDGSPMLRHIVALEDCVQSYLLMLETAGIEGETYHIAMNDPFNYYDAAAYAAERLDIDVIELIDPMGKDFCVDVTKARYQLGYQPNFDIFRLIDSAIEFRRSGRERRERSGIKG
ncbi:MAG: NAD(P)-dependent oxidoreductase, partial [Planctomycetota bacterium]|nr:NAD(P)-dependent oxidoreductase [Planctomycetota bacterium]